MKFQVWTSSLHYNNNTEKEHIRNLKDIGFKTTPVSYNNYLIDIDEPIQVEINTLEELVEISKRLGGIIISTDNVHEDIDVEMEIYDGYRE